MTVRPTSFKQLAALIRREREALLEKWRDQVRRLPSAKGFDVPTLNDHIPLLLDELASALEAGSKETIAEALIAGTPPAHGRQRLRDGFDIEEVVAEYNILRGCIHDLADANELTLTGASFHTVNRVLDESIGLAVQTFATESAFELQKRREQYLAFVAHDLKTPLNAIALATRVLERVLPPQDADSQHSRMLKALDRNVKQLATLVESVLKENTRLQSESSIRLELRDVDLWSLVEVLLVDLEAVVQAAGSRVSNQVPDDIVAYADASVLRRILQNLISNAIKYAPRGEIAVGARDTADAVECWVQDNGSGIPADRLERIFDALETDAAESGGTGLGLSIVKSYVEAHGGRVEVESQEGVGSTFRFTLPARLPKR